MLLSPLPSKRFLHHHRLPSSLLLSLGLFRSFGYATGSEIKITNENEFSTFIENVNTGTNYSGTTVFLDSDLSLSGETLEPIGKDSDRYFLGVFDGQGHIISNIKIDSSTSQYAGLFGYSAGLTIRNVVLDSSCSIASSYSGSGYTAIGGLIGSCYAYSDQCTIMNSVNMADVTFSGDISGSDSYLNLGGVGGDIYSPSSYSNYVKNCANYGSIVYSGSSDYPYVGGITGDFYGSSSTCIYLHNCLNYGAITDSGTTSFVLYLGDITGHSDYAYIENCVSAGKISTPTTASSSSYVGSVVGYIDSGTHINYCYYTSELSEYDLYGTGTPTSSSYTLSYDNSTFELSETVSIGSYAGNSLIGTLNAAVDYYVLRDYSKWLLNEEKKTVKFTINGRTSPITMNYQVILLPSLASEEGIAFDGWYIDNVYTSILEPFEITEDTDLYGRFKENANNYTITFDPRREGVSVEPITTLFGATVSLPSESFREHCSAYWVNEYGDYIGSSIVMPARNFTLYAVWKCTCISLPDDFIDFSKLVNSGTDCFSGSTVLLDSDLSFSGKTLEPIGKDSVNYFNGVFDGQGHVISDLKISSSSFYTGLFVFSWRLAIRNVILDSSCSITSSYSGSGAYIGGVIGRCYADGGECNIENIANMADVTFSGDISNKYLYLGGIIGQIYSYYGFVYVKNCANYGSVTHSGTSGYSYIGGIVGYLCDYTSSYIYLHNCLNYGTITHSGTASSGLYLGGIAGYNKYSYIENCVSAGKISSAKINYIGSIVGWAISPTYINYCYYTSELSGHDSCGKGTPTSSSYTLSYDSTTFELSETVSIGNFTGNSLIRALNAYSDYYFLRDYSKWLLNKDSKFVKFTINGRTSPITMNSQVVLLPSLISEEGIAFDGWYIDSECINPLESFEITEDTDLYGRFKENANNYTITFDTRRDGISVAPITAQYLSTVSLPNNLTKGYCRVASWETEDGTNVGSSLTMLARNFTLYAVWKCTHIATLEDFIDFSKLVNSGTDCFSESTVLLDSDLSFSGKTLEPIGKDSDSYFGGVFDGQGHVISDLKMNSFSRYTGLFGYSEGLTIRNVILDSSCSITSSLSGPGVYVGGIVGYCNAKYEQCVIENNVNMADATFNGITGDYEYLYLGGIIGNIYSSSSYSTYVKNCANYGSVTHSGTSGDSYIGGIVGYLYGYSSSYIYLHNCLNYGTITHGGTTISGSYLGGIAGYSTRTYIENCVDAGKISTPKNPRYGYIGSIVGQVGSNAYINYCYYTSELSEHGSCGKGTPTNSSHTLSYDNITFELSETVSIGSYAGNSLIGALNAAVDYYVLRDYSKWLLNKDSKFVNFTINGRTSPIAMNYQVVLLPGLASEEGIAFDGWYKDNEYTNPLESFEITEDTDLYGRFKENANNYTITFDPRKEGVLVAPITAQFGATISLQSKTSREHCSAYWVNEYDDYIGSSIVMPARNFTLYAAMWKCTHISTPDDFIDFSKLVNSGTDYFEGSTVYLDTDLSLSEITLEPIGKEYENYFGGVFDGQGHVISDLVMNSSSQYTGLFGFFRGGPTIRNVILDSSCSLTSSYSGPYNLFIGGIVGYCYARYGNINIENSVNMADVTFNRNITSVDLFIGGFSGYINFNHYATYVKNCVNYGSITHSGTSYRSYIGGIAGYNYGLGYIYLYNCFNYGTITHSGTTPNSLYVGGITGYSYMTFIVNCLSAGRISSNNDTFVGAIVGYIDPETSVKYCYYTNGVNVNTFNGTGTSKRTTGTPFSPTNADSTLISNLNDYASGNSWNKWLLNTNNVVISFKINNNTSFTANSQIVLVPDLATDDSLYAFSGWYADEMLISQFTDDEINVETTLYGMLCGSSNYTVSLDANGGDVSSISPLHRMVISCNNVYGRLSDVHREGYTFIGWYTESEGGDRVEPGDEVANMNDHTLYAHWSANNYTVTFDVNGGNELTVTSITVTFNSTYGELPEADKEGYMFVGWFTNETNWTKVTKDTIVNIVGNHTLYAHWEKVTNKVEIVFGAKDLTKEDVEKIVKEYVAEGTEFTIVEISTDETGETKVIIKFTDADKAEEFVRTVNGLSRDDNTFKRVGFAPDNDPSFSLLLCPITFFFNIMLI